MLNIFLNRNDTNILHIFITYVNKIISYTYHKSNKKQVAHRQATYPVKSNTYLIPILPFTALTFLPKISAKSLSLT